MHDFDLSATHTDSHTYTFNQRGNIHNFPQYNHDKAVTYGKCDQAASLASLTPATDYFNYDGNGNPTTYKGGKCLYDPENHLTDYWLSGLNPASDAPTLSAAYRSDGLLAWKDVAGQRTYFIYDGDKMIGEVTNASKSSVPVLTAFNNWGPNGIISRSTYASGAFSTVFYQYDPVGNVAQRTNSAGALLTNERYDAWGNVCENKHRR